MTVWTMRDGTKKAVARMTESQLRNALALMLDKLEDVEGELYAVRSTDADLQRDCIGVWILRFENELNSRGFRLKVSLQ